MWDYRVNVTQVVDGDTIHVYADRGTSDYSMWAVRLFGVYAPELKQPGGPQTRDFVNEWVLDHADDAAWPFVLVMARTKNDSHELTTLGRWLGMLYTPDRSECLNISVSAFVKANGYGGGIGT